MQNGIMRSFSDVVINRAARALVIAGLSWGAANLHHIDQCVAALWADLRTRWWFLHDSFEPVQSTLCFVALIVYWRQLDRSGLWKRWRIQKESSDVAWQDAWGRTYQAFWYIAPLALFDFFFPRRTLPVKAPTALQVCAEVACSILVYDVLFFCGHAFLHQHPMLYKWIHAPHHTHSASRACESIRHHLLDGSFDVSCSIVALKVAGSHPISRAIHNLVLIYLIMELHAGYDAPFMLHNIVPFRLIGGPPCHDHHHKYGRYYHQKFFMFMDHLFGFVPPEGKRAQRLI